MKKKIAFSFPTVKIELYTHMHTKKMYGLLFGNRKCEESKESIKKIEENVTITVHDCEE